MEDNRIIEDMFNDKIAMDFDLEKHYYERSLKDIDNVLDSLNIEVL